MASPVRSSRTATARGRARATAEERPACGDQAAFDLGQAELCRAGGYDQVAGEDEFEPAAERYALDGCDDRLAPLAADESVLSTVRRCGASRFLHVGASAEDPARAGQDGDPEYRFRVECVERGRQLVGHSLVDGVVLVRPVHRNQQDMVTGLGPDHRLGAHLVIVAGTAPAGANRAGNSTGSPRPQIRESEGTCYFSRVAGAGIFADWNLQFMA